MIQEFNKQQAAAYLEISAPTLDRWIKSGKVKVRRIPDAKVGQQSIIVLLEVPDVAPVTTPVPEPVAEPEPIETASAVDYVDSMGNSRLTPKEKKVSLLGPNPELPEPTPVQDAAAHWAEWRRKFSPSDGTRDAAGPLAGRPNFYSKNEQQKRAAHDRAVIRASFPRAERT